LDIAVDDTDRSPAGRRRYRQSADFDVLYVRTADRLFFNPDWYFPSLDSKSLKILALGFKNGIHRSNSFAKPLVQLMRISH
jgi:hypothetical protein